MDHKITTPLTAETIQQLKTGDMVKITGIIYSARDAAHKKLIELIEAGKELPFELNGNVIYYLGPTPARDGQVIGSAGPTTSSRMDKYTPKLLELGLKGMIGKGRRSPKVIQAIVENRAVYLAAVGGAGALLSKCIKSSKVIAFDELGTEAVREMYVEDFPAIVAIDSEGNNIYKD
ncbi:MAG: Fe-S-containing hydro-lyase [Lachnospiraceae bacterium]|nr:Fe-S-containing hydro-lyase [Lachnospiraceae bacterium]